MPLATFMAPWTEQHVNEKVNTSFHMFYKIKKL